METEIKLTKLASCAGCSAKVGAGTLSKLLDGIETLHDDNLIVGFDKSDDASVYVINDETALIQTIDFFPPIVDDPFLFGQIAAANSISDIYAMGGTPRLALNVMCLEEHLDTNTVHEILRGGYSKAFEAGVIISGGHTINAATPLYGLSVSGFAHPDEILTNSGAREGDVLILTKRLGVGIITTAAKANLVPDGILNSTYLQMATLNKAARDMMMQYDVHACTDITGFSLLGHSLEMAEGSGVCINIDSSSVKQLPMAYDFAQLGFIPQAAYNNRAFAKGRILVSPSVDRATQDILYNPETSGGLLISVSESDSQELYKRLSDSSDDISVVGYVTKKDEYSLALK